MKTQNPIPAYVPTTRTPRSWIKGRNPAGNLISNHLRRKQSRPVWPPGTGDTTGLQHASDSNRLWHSQIYSAWKNLIGPAEQAAYETAAASFTLLNNKGQRKTPNGFQLFTWWASYTAYDCWVPPLPWNWYPDFWNDIPPDPSWPKPVPRNLQLTSSTPPYFTVDFICDSDLTQYTGWLQLTEPSSPGQTTPTSGWQRLAQLDLYTTANQSFIPAYTTSAVVPPWTATPTYVAANWTIGLGLVTPFGVTSIQTIRAGMSVQTYRIITTMGATHVVVSAAMLSWGIDPGSGARTGLILTWNDPATNIPYVDGHPRFFVVTYSSWTSTFTAATTGLAWPGYVGNLQSYVVTRDYTTDTVATPAGTITHANGGSLPPTDAGLDASFNNVRWSSYNFAGPLHMYQCTANYQGVIENPANPGPRGLRLTLGANYEVNMLHSDWIEATISL